MMSDITFDEKTGRFEWEIEGQTAFLLFRPLDEKTWIYTYVFVPPTLRGQNYAAKLTRHALDYAREKGVKVQPTCPYIQAFIEKNRAEFKSMLA